jgi:hypothetical protein
VLSLPWLLERAPPPFEGDEIKYPEGLVRHFLGAYTKRGDRVLDPFAGLGTTLFVAEEMGRVPFGVEADGLRRDWVAGQLRHWQNVRHGDSGKLASFELPKMAFAMTSPPFMAAHHRWNPLYGGDPRHAGYDRYLRRMRHVFAQLALVMRRGAVVVVHADNLPGRTFTPLVADLGDAARASFRQEDEVIVAWTNRPSHTHCLIFRTR